MTFTAPGYLLCGFINAVLGILLATESQSDRVAEGIDVFDVVLLSVFNTVTACLFKFAGLHITVIDVTIIALVSIACSGFLLWKRWLPQARMIGCCLLGAALVACVVFVVLAIVG